LVKKQFPLRLGKSLARAAGAEEHQQGRTGLKAKREALEDRHFARSPAAVVLSLLAGTWKLKPAGWHPLGVEERQQLATMAARTANCTRSTPSDTEIEKLICTTLLNDFRARRSL